METFTKLRQTQSVEEYQSQFEALSNRITGLTDEFRIFTFISGLEDEIRIIVTMFKPQTLSAAFGLARLQEEERRRANRSNQPKAFQNQTPFISKASPTPLLQFKPNNPTNPKPENRVIPYNPNPKRPLIPMKRLTPAQMQERCDQGLCYNCDEKYQFGHRCKRSQLFLWEEMDEMLITEVEGDEDSAVAASPEKYTSSFSTQGKFLQISLNTIIGVHFPQTMRIEGIIHNHKFLLLINSGSTHSFIDSYIASQLKLPPEPLKKKS